MQEIDFYKIRPFNGGKSEAFEELCCQVFHRMSRSKLPDEAQFSRYRGAGGDGGVEAVWTFSDGKEWGLQAKYFNNLGTTQFRQMEKSLNQAIDNHPELSRYIYCFPFNITGPVAAGKRGKSQHEKLDEWRLEQLKKLEEKDVSLSIEFWTESELRDRLIEVDPEGGMRRYWFDKELMTKDWIRERLMEAKEQAGDRYSPKLSVKVPAFDALEAFACAESWQKKIAEIQKSFKETKRKWSYTKDIMENFPKIIAKKSKLISEALSLINEQLIYLSSFSHTFNSSIVMEKINYVLEEGEVLESVFLKDLLDKHGENADTPGFRQFSAEYLVSFPAQKLDTVRDLLENLGELNDWLASNEANLSQSQTMLLKGPAGIGKTHAIVDHALYRDIQNQISLIFYGEDFEVEEPWKVIRSKLGLSDEINRDELWGMINTGAEITGKPALIYIDALNESLVREKWKKSWLPSLRQQLSHFSWIKLCVSCRDTYLEEVMETSEYWPAFEHNGFIGREFDAIREFFDYYQLTPPATPLLQKEFASPLFLHLVCQGLQGESIQSIPLGSMGFSDVLRLFLTEKNKRIAEKCKYDPRDDKLSQAMLVLAEKMMEYKSYVLPFDIAKRAVDSIFTVNEYERSLFSQLEKEGLISLFEKKSRPLGPIEWFCRFTFERVADHLIATLIADEIKLEDIDREIKLEKSIFTNISEENISEYRGLLEALSIILPEKYGLELSELSLEIGRKKETLPIIFSGFQWREPESFSLKTEQLIREGLSSHEASLAVMDAIIGVSLISNHPYNGNYIDNLLSMENMTERDPFWSAILNENFEEKGSTWRLIEWALKADLSNFSDETMELWSIILGWFCAASDRRVRDKSSKGLVRLFLSKESMMKKTFIHFLKIDDDYILERVSLACYSATLRSGDNKSLKELAHTIYDRVFSEGNVPLNALTRDWLRLILELAHQRNLTAKYVKTEKFRPPYQSKFPSFPSELEIKHLTKKEAFKGGMDLGQGGIGTDFARYILKPYLLGRFDLESSGITKEDVYRWFIKNVHELGYPGRNERCYHFDRHLISKYGGGRGKPVWAERLGKKYYWILLYRLGGIFADYLQRNDGIWEETTNKPRLPELQGIPFRNIDTTDLRTFSTKPLMDDNWWNPVSYDFNSVKLKSNEEWVWDENFPDIRESHKSIDYNEEEWIHLSLNSSLKKSIGTDPNSTYPYRNMTTLFESAFVPITALEDIRKELAAGRNSFEFGSLKPSDYQVHLGEYPHTLTFNQSVEMEEIHLTCEIPGYDKADITTIQFLRGGEYEYDCSGHSENLLAPSPDLLNYGELNWDGKFGWIDQDDNIQIISMENSDDSGLLVKKAYLKDYLQSQSKVLLSFSIQEKLLITGNINKIGINEVFSVFGFDGEDRFLLNQYTPLRR